ncbi:MAG: hypothetical protein QXU40_02555 [Candidatus Pacearchaeota archaeon]
MKTMKNFTIILALILSNLANGQNATDIIIKQIRAEYQKIQSNKNNYTKKLLINQKNYMLLMIQLMKQLEEK